MTGYMNHTANEVISKLGDQNLYRAGISNRQANRKKSMNNHLLHMLREWQPLKRQCRWVLGVIYKTEGSCYRKAGAMMLISSDGHQLGVLSGGCLETDIHKKARRVMDDAEPRFATYDDEDEHDIAFQLGVGCGGVVHVALVPVTGDNTFLHFDGLLASLEQAIPCFWQLNVGDAVSAKVTQDAPSTGLAVAPAEFVGKVGEDGVLTCRCAPPVHLLIVGAGLDATDVARLATALGWQISVWDPRPGKAHSALQMSAVTVIKGSEKATLQQYVAEHGVHAAILMSHHRDVDAMALSALSPTPVGYIAMLGPPHRRSEILGLAGLDEQGIGQRLFSPAGLNIGGELPESIALSVIAECHASLYQRRGESLSQKL